MNHRICWLLPNVESVRNSWGALLFARAEVGQRHCPADLLTGLSTPGRHIRHFDALRSRVHEVERQQRVSHPEALVEGEKPGIPAFSVEAGR